VDEGMSSPISFSALSRFEEVLCALAESCRAAEESDFCPAAAESYHTTEKRKIFRVLEEPFP
jgi:hypothetical protein